MGKKGKLGKVADKRHADRAIKLVADAVEAITMLVASKRIKLTN